MSGNHDHPPPRRRRRAGGRRRGRERGEEWRLQAGLTVCLWPGTLGAVETRQRQADRTRETKRKLMEATVECLVERGWSGTTTTEVAERAGVSRGAQLHHFRTRGELVAAAVEHVGVESVEVLKR